MSSAGISLPLGSEAVPYRCGAKPSATRPAPDPVGEPEIQADRGVWDSSGHRRRGAKYCPPRGDNPPCDNQGRAGRTPAPSCRRLQIPFLPLADGSPFALPPHLSAPPFPLLRLSFRTLTGRLASNASHESGSPHACSICRQPPGIRRTPSRPEGRWRQTRTPAEQTTPRNSGRLARTAQGERPTDIPFACLYRENRPACSTRTGGRRAPSCSSVRAR